MNMSKERFLSKLDTLQELFDMYCLERHDNDVAHMMISDLRKYVDNIKEQHERN